MRRLVLLVALLASTAAEAETRFGILYTGWHCLVTAQGGRPFSVTSEALGGRRPWGALTEFHFWAEPREGFYCLTDRPDVLTRHAILLRDAGIDFIVFDATNIQSRSDPDARASVIDPFGRLLEVWSNIEGAPKVVPWAPLTAKGDMLEWMVTQIPTRLQFVYEGLPLALITENATFPADAAKIIALQRTHTTRKMWGLMLGDSANWSFLSVCQPGFLASQARIPCRQQRAMSNGRVEQVAVTPSYQETYISYKATAVPRFEGRTFVRQFERLYDEPPAIAIISGWNEWMAQRLCLDEKRVATDRGCVVDHWPDGSKVFVDQYDKDYSRDIEPTRNSDFYYRLMVRCIAAFRKGERCDTGP